jgi:hypothetical protein
MKDWEAYELLFRFVEEKFDKTCSPSLPTHEANGWFDAMNDAEKQLRALMKPFEDALYARYSEHKGYPWCDKCGGSVRAYVTGFEHDDKSLNGDAYMEHEITLKEYHWGWEALIQKRLRGEIE